MTIKKQKRFQSEPSEGYKEYGKSHYGRDTTRDSSRDSRDTRDASQAGQEVKEEIAMLAGMKPVLEGLQKYPKKMDSVSIRKGKKGNDIDAIVTLCRDLHIRFAFVEEQVLDKLFAGNHQGVVARLFDAGFMEYEDLLEGLSSAELPLIVALDQVQDPGNAGTLARTLYGLGGAGLVTVKHGGAPLGNAALRSSAGALMHLPVARVTNLAQALDKAVDMGIHVYGAKGMNTTEDDADTADAESNRNSKVKKDAIPAENIFTTKLLLPAILVLGNEELGIRPNVLKRCEATVYVPLLRDFDSLNVAQAGGIMAAFFATAHGNKK